MVKYCKLQIANCKLQIAEGTATYRVLPTACRFTIYNLHFAFCIFQFFSVGFVLSAAIFAGLHGSFCTGLAWFMAADGERQD